MGEIARQTKGQNIRILLSAGTPQGIGVLHAGVKHLHSLDIDIVYFPIDAPSVMKRAFKVYAPQQVVIVETELWPSFLIEAHKSGVPVRLVNGRMSEKSHKSYRRLHRFFTHYGPQNIYAISNADCCRFHDVCTKSLIQQMNNIKFDRLQVEEDKSIGEIFNTKELSELFDKSVKNIVLGSIRRQEEAQILELVVKILATENNISIALFPKHESRADELCEKLQLQGVDAKLRSANASGEKTKVIVWDKFGELTKAYHHADAVFVGGSLEKLGGQNFLEPLIAGVRPIIGPYYHNFLWVGEEVFEMGLVQRVQNVDTLYAELCHAVHHPIAEDFPRRVKAYLQQKQGGTALVVIDIVKALNINR